ncbi:thiol:disulfide interchange protein DsbA/DsbL [Paucibacter sp. DJ1R-11]|uniref:thiol:disulfide interchange protein DsbA/DsbL n=1 Tax=Paucibacter sp. DJ1R-11 TaxID=2893556 RepID=UPI0021E4FB75|nr:thiol:disulfide interchange protein DsbA/DsbL [Paucibacter sp. DJ1R-11]MCV2362356.1 thiol:disulfide interchange protein DsbA/DsbL [Paucibacter sp. DJ1R-11]
MKPISRRDFSVCLAATGLPALSQAQGAAPVEGKQYLRLAQPLAATPGKIEVYEFFLYTCPHCFAFDPLVSAWVKQLPADVSFRRIHVGVGAMHKLHQRLMATLETLGRLADLHEAVFKAIHVQHLDLSDEKAIIKFAASLGLDEAKFTSAFNDKFNTQRRIDQAASLAKSYGVETVPAIGIGGRYMTSPSLAGGPGKNAVSGGQAALALTNQLIQQLRSAKS